MSRPVVGVLGGMGPAATIDFMGRVLARTPAVSDQDHVRMIVDQNPWVPNRNDAVAGRGGDPAEALAAMARGLERAGAELLAMPCNAAHAFTDTIRASTPLPFIDMIAATVAAARAALPGLRTVGVLASEGCLEAGLYQRAFDREAVLVASQGEMATFMDLLYRIKLGETGPAARAAMRDLAGALVGRGAEAIVAGCTEVPLVLDAADLAVPLISSTDALADAVISASCG